MSHRGPIESRVTGVADHFTPGVERAHRLDLSPPRQGILRRKRQRPNIDLLDGGLAHDGSSAQDKGRCRPPGQMLAPKKRAA